MVHHHGGYIADMLYLRRGRRFRRRIFVFGRTAAAR
jgi:hypothetical protein